MGTGIFFPVCALPIIVIIITSFNLKAHIKSEETELFNFLCILNAVGLVIEILCSFACRMADTHYFLSIFILKSYLVYLIFWTALFTTYIIKLSNTKINKVFRLLHRIIVIILSAIIYVLPIEIVVKNNYQIYYTTGIGVKFSYFVSFVYVIIILFSMLKNIKNLKSKKYLPVFLFFIIGTISIVIQRIYPQFLLLTYAETLICLCMYFTIENPDVQMMEELYKNKKLIEKSSEDTSNFLFRMTQDIKKPIKDIFEVSNDMFNINDLSELKDGTKIINNKARELDYLVNDALDVSTMSTKTIKVFDTRYNVLNLFKEIKYQAENKINKKVRFEYSISNNLPSYLYGDSIKLKQAIYSVLENSIKNTSSGFISLEINSIVKYNICRLIINISDSGSGMNIEDVNDILSLNIEDLSKINLSSDKKELNLKEIKKLITFLGGNLIVKSEDGKGTDVSITIDQKIVEVKDNEISKKLDLYEQSLHKNKKIMVVDDDVKELSKITNYLEKKDMNVSGSLFGRDVIDKISNKHKFDLILLDDETDTYSAYEVLKELKKDKKFNIPVVILIDDQKEFIKLHFLKDGFADVILKSKLESELDRILKRF